MTHGEIHNAATRIAVLEAAADKYAGEELPFWDSSEYMNGICSVIADAFGVLDPENARTEIWEQIRDAHRSAALREEAEKIASREIERWWNRPDTDASPLVDVIAAEREVRGDLFQLITQAALAGLKEKS